MIDPALDQGLGPNIAAMVNRPLNCTGGLFGNGFSFCQVFGNADKGDRARTAKDVEAFFLLN